MKPKHLVLLGALAAAGLALAAPLALEAARTTRDNPQQSEEPFASIKEIKPFSYCCIVHKGPLTDMSGVIVQFMQAMQSQGLFPSIRGPMVGVYYNSPAQVKPEELSWEVGFVVSEEAAPKPPLEKKNWSYPTVAVAVHVGPYANVSETIQKLTDWMKGKGYSASGPVLERYLNNPMQVKPEELRTEIWIPALKK
jgi:effector-binding domain-containing protein